MQTHDREFAVYYARVLIAQARVFRLRGTPAAKHFAQTLLDWAEKSRQQAMAKKGQLQLWT